MLFKMLQVHIKSKDNVLKLPPQGLMEIECLPQTTQANFFPAGSKTPGNGLQVAMLNI